MDFELPDKFLDILYNILRKQNIKWFKFIAAREGIPVQTLYKKYLPSKKELAKFIASKT